MVFTNLQDSSVQLEIKKLCQGKSGVYKITHLENQKSYVGSVLTKKPSLNGLYIRFRNHFFNHHKPFPMSRAIKKDGVEKFSWEILEFTDRATTRARETYYLQLLKPDSTLLGFAENSLGYSHRPDTRLKMKSGFRVERRVKVGNLNSKKKLSLEVREKRSKALSKRTSHQKQRPQQACDAFKKLSFSKPTQVLDATNLKILGNYSSLREACRVWNGSSRTFKRVVKSGEKIHKFNIYVKYIS